MLVVLKSQSETRWNARLDAVKNVRNYLDEILQVLQDNVDDENATTETRYDANLLFNRILHHELFALLGFWNSVLIRIDRVQKRLQDPTMNFHDASFDLKGLCDYVIASREDLVADSLEEGLSICRRWQVDVKPCRRSQRVIHDVSINAKLTAKNNMRRTMTGARFSRLHDLDTKFGFVFDVQFLRNAIHLETSTATISMQPNFSKKSSIAECYLQVANTSKYQILKSFSNLSSNMEMKVCSLTFASRYRFC
ncbi:Hypothetical predicted protein [Octopus vulgaris]|uniref:Uncharacterized protein n=1 Tax=Octopus vulgaris TaxID=6645 RepID=A0AA36B5L5_OCTVU|nr:Hypothetical predicted protein [Octopus vulgaris]